MAWETRNGTGRYYTRSVKRDGRVCREYIGQGPVAEAIAQLDGLDRDRREFEHWQQREAERQRSAQDEQVRDFCEQVDLLTRLALVSAGYHQHDRGEWRRRRGEE